jgi:predicted NUDIX family phosphoesterase
LVSAFIVRHDNRYLTYKRSKRLPESRLHGDYSISFGGHLTPQDLFDQAEWPADPLGTLWNIFDPVNGITLLMREFREELRTSHVSFRYRGLLYDDRRQVSRQHIGIVYDAWLSSSDYEIGERGFLIDDKFESLEEITARYRDFENWSHLIIDREREAAGASDEH